MSEDINKTWRTILFILKTSDMEQALAAAEAIAGEENVAIVEKIIKEKNLKKA